MFLNTLTPFNLADFYKTGHIFQYPKNTEYVYANFTPRSARLAKFGDDYDKKVVVYGYQGFVKEFLVDLFRDSFFALDKQKAVAKYKRRLDNALGKGAVSTQHIEDLYDLGFLPLCIKAIKEGSRVNVGVPQVTIINTLPNFYWLTNYIETLFSAECWKAPTTATIADQYKRLLTRYAIETGAPVDFVMWQGHDFSMRGMSGVADAAKSGSGHLLSFFGTDTIPAIDYLEAFYGANSDVELIGGSVPATEHSVMCAGGKDDEIETFRRLIADVYPEGIVSIVSDTWDYWQVLTEFTVKLKDVILNRKPNALGLAKVVFRPDSGDPVKIICGDPDAPVGSPEYKGSIECLWDVFGGTTTEKGFKVLNERVGLIYGDSITLERAERILEGLKQKGFASCNVVFGIGSYTYQYLTRDTLGWAVKATAVQQDGVMVEMFKDPKTDAGTKKSAKGLLKVVQENGQYFLKDQQQMSLEQLFSNQEGDELEVIFFNGMMPKMQTLSEIRNRLAASM